MLCTVVEKIDESPAGTYSWNNGYRYDYRGSILCFKTPENFDEYDICDFMYENKERFPKGGGCYKSLLDLIAQSTSGLDLFEDIEATVIDGDSESLVQFFWLDTNNVPVMNSDYLLRLEYTKDLHTFADVIHIDQYDENEESDGEWKNDSGVYIRKLNPDYFFDLTEWKNDETKTQMLRYQAHKYKLSTPIR